MDRRGLSTLILAASLMGVVLLAACAPTAVPTATPAKGAAPAPTATAAAKTEPTKPAVTPTAAPKALQKLKMASPTTGLAEMAQKLASKKGFFAEEGLEVEITSIKSDVALKAMVGGELDFIFSLGTTLRAAATGVPVKAVLAAIAKPYHVLVVRPEIKEGKDLKGKVASVDSIGGTTDYLVRKSIEHYGLDPDKDVTVMAMGGNPERMAALQAGSVQATVLESLYAIKAQNAGMRPILKMADITEMPVAGLAASDKMIKERPDLVLRVVRATVKGLKFIKDTKNKDEMIGFMAQEFNVSKEEATAVYPDLLRSFSDDGFASEQSIMSDVKMAIERAGANPNTKIADVFDFTFVKKVKEGS